MQTDLEAVSSAPDQASADIARLMWAARRPIETAPDDGTEILAFGPIRWADKDEGVGPPVWATVSWRLHWSAESEPAGRWELANANPYTDVMEARFWLPVPAE